MPAVDWQALLAVLGDTPQVVGAWVFGSSAPGVVRPGSDLDLGVLFAAPPSMALWTGLRARLQQALQVDEIDLVSPNQASALLRFEAISGRRLVCRDEAAVAAFASLTAREYEDEMAQPQRALRWAW